jgi:succinate dehydrogenase/fumarate reductase flavoprotein subunit
MEDSGIKQYGKGTMGRRSFIAGGAALLGAAAVGLGACSPSQATDPDGSSKTEASEVPRESWRTPPEPIDESDIAETLDCEVLVVGSGNSGCFAAAAAAEAGADVILIEKQDRIGFTHRGWIGGVGSRYQREAGIEIDVDEIVETLCFYASHRCDQRVIRLWVENSGKVVDWLGDVIAEYDPRVYLHLETDLGNPNHGIYKTWAVQHTVENGNLNLYVPLHNSSDGKTNEMDDYTYPTGLQLVSQKVMDLGVRIKTRFPMVQLERTDDSGRVTGAIAHDREADRYVRVRASKGVILCTGGYAGNEEMMREINPLETSTCTGLAAAGEINSGDGIRAGAWIGAKKQESGGVQVFDRGGVPPDAVAGCMYSQPGILTLIGSQPFLKVNRNGERFSNESVPYDFIYYAATEQPTSLYCAIWDANWREQTRQFRTLGCSRLQRSPSGTGMMIQDEDTVEAFHKEVLIPMGIVVESETLEGLAEKLKIPASTFVATVKRYNELCAKGVDEDFGKESYRMMPIDTSPYSAATLGGQVVCTMDGLLIDTDLRVLDAERKPIDGLYAAGNDSGGFFAYNYPELVVGATCSRAMTFGYLAGKSAASA